MSISYVVDGAIIECSEAIGKSTLSKNYSNSNLELHGKVMVTVADNKPYANIKPFPFCKSNKNPTVISNGMKPSVCIPAMCMKWMKGKNDVYLNGELALNSDSKAACLYGGIIKIIDDGQRKL